MKIPGIKAIKRVTLWAQSRLEPHTVILGYHRVADISRDLYEICVSPVHFQEQMEVLNRFANPIRLQDLISGLKNGNLPPRSVVVTFDDGYAELLNNVKPVLECFQVPCTVFMVSGYLGQEFWWDELERLGQGRKLDKQAIKSLYRQLMPLCSSERQKAVEKLREAETSLPGESSPTRAMNLYELLEFARGDLIEIGSHGVNHLSLSRLSVEEQNSELFESKAFLEGCLRKPISSFSYPNGSSSLKTRSFVKKNRYKCACSSNHGVVYRSSDPFNLPRFWIPNWNGTTFKRWLHKWL